MERARAAEHRHLEHQFRAAAHADRRAFPETQRPDVLCLQETKCPDGAFPLKRFKRLGYKCIAVNGQKGYHGVAMLSRLPFESESTIAISAARTTRRHVAVTLGERPAAATCCIISMSRPAATSPIPRSIRSSRTSSRSERCKRWRRFDRSGGERAILVGDLNVAPLETRRLEPQAAVQRRQPHADRSARNSNAVQKVGGWVDTMRHHVPIRRSCTPGGAIARQTGKSRQGPPARPRLGWQRLAAAGTRRPLPRPSKKHAAGSGRPTTCR